MGRRTGDRHAVELVRVRSTPRGRTASIITQMAGRSTTTRPRAPASLARSVGTQIASTITPKAATLSQVQTCVCATFATTLGTSPPTARRILRAGHTAWIGSARGGLPIPRHPRSLTVLSLLCLVQLLQHLHGAVTKRQK